jgi:hypothetical protein
MPLTQISTNQPQPPPSPSPEQQLINDFDQQIRNLKNIIIEKDKRIDTMERELEIRTTYIKQLEQQIREKTEDKEKEILLLKLKRINKIISE